MASWNQAHLYFSTLKGGTWEETANKWPYPVWGGWGLQVREKGWGSGLPGEHWSPTASLSRLQVEKPPSRAQRHTRNWPGQVQALLTSIPITLNWKRNEEQGKHRVHLPTEADTVTIDTQCSGRQKSACPRQRHTNLCSSHRCWALGLTCLSRSPRTWSWAAGQTEAASDQASL